MQDEVRVALVALGGYGNFYLKALFEKAEDHGARLVAGIDPDPVRCEYLDRLSEEGIPIYPDLDHFYAFDSADLVVIAAPIHLHMPFTLTALAHGSNVLCEKPLTATIQEALQMAEAEKASGRFVGVGYQWSFAEPIQALKRDVMDGVLGRPLRMVTKLLWPRSASYYQRNTWAAKLKTEDGRWVLDSPAHNATGHYLHNCFYLLGPTRESSARPERVRAELYRANAIENYDTAAIRCRTAEDVEIVFLTTHAVKESVGPILRYEFEKAVVEFEAWEGPLLARFHDGTIKTYGNPFANEDNKLWQAVQAVRTGAPLACGIQAAIPQVLAINGAQEAMWDINDFPADLLRGDGSEEDRLIWVEGLQQVVERCFDAGKLPSELGDVPWARPGQCVRLDDYTYFPSYH